MCGSSAAEDRAAAQESGLGTALNSSFAKNFGAQSSILQNLTNVMTPIAQAGPDQQGFGANELASLNTQAGQGIGQNYNKAQQALQNNLAARGGGNEMLPTGAEASLKANLASSAANQLSNSQLAITNANYAQGRQNWQNATSQLENVGKMEDPLGYAGAASGATQAGYQMQAQNSNMGYQQFGEIAGGIAALGGAAAGMMPGSHPFTNSQQIADAGLGPTPGSGAAEQSMAPSGTPNWSLSPGS